MKAALALMALMTLSACGFQPVYGTWSGEQSGVPQELAQIGIATIPERNGQILRTYLQQRLAATEQPDSFPYVLRIALEERLIDLGLQPDAVTTRTQVRILARFSLINRSAGQPITSGRARATTSFNILDSELATDVSAQDARERALESVGDEIVQQLALHFQRAAE